jgi:hypothetical protein
MPCTYNPDGNLKIETILIEIYLGLALDLQGLEGKWLFLIRR